MRVAEHALIVTFLKYRGSECPPISDSGLMRLACYHHYDEITLKLTSGTVEQVMDSFNIQSPERAITAKRVLCFLIEGECSDDFRFDAIGPYIEVILLRIRQGLPVPSLVAESRIVDAIKSIGVGVGWRLAHTLARNECLLIVSHGSSVTECDRLAVSLRDLRLHPKSQERAFDQVVIWPCMKSGPYANQASSGTENPESLVAVSGIRVVGSCQDPHSGRKCMTGIRQAVRGPGDAPPGGIGQGTDNDREAIWEAARHDAIKVVRLARSNCPEACCSYYLVRQTSETLLQTSLFDEAVVPKEPDPIPTNLLHSLSRIKSTKGSGLIGVRLEAARNRIAQALENPLVRMEFDDLRQVLDRFALVKKCYDTDAELRRADPNNLEHWVGSRAYANNLAFVMDQACEERVREDLCGPSHQLRPAALGASGVSRLTAVSRHAIRSTLNAFGVPWRGVCVNGVVPVYKVDAWLGLFNSVPESTLDPYLYFGLGHELGHVLWSTYVLGEPPMDWEGNPPPRLLSNAEIEAKDPFTRKEMAEYFSDAICLRYTFDDNATSFIDAWVRYYLSSIETENLLGFISDLTSQPRAAATSTSQWEQKKGWAEAVSASKALIYAQRLMVAVAYHLVTENRPDEIIPHDTLERIRASQTLAQYGDAGYAGRALSRILLTYDQVAKRQDVPPLSSEERESMEKFLRNLPAIGKWLRALVGKLPSEGVPPGRTGEEYARAVITKAEVCEKPASLPLLVLQRIGYGAQFRVCTAASLSLTHWEEMVCLHG